MTTSSAIIKAPARTASVARDGLRPASIARATLNDA